MRLPRTVRLLVLALTFVVVVAAPARAADVIDQHNPLPSQPVSFPLDRPMAQTFRPGVNGRLTRVRFWLSQFAMPATIRVEVYSTYPDGTPSNELLATGEIDALAFPPLQSEYEASFATHPQLSTSQLYSIVLSPTGSSSFASWTLLATRNDAYAAGAAEEKDTQWAAITGADFAFTTFEDTLDTVAPTTSYYYESGSPGDNGWWRSDVTYLIHATDDLSGVKNTHCWIDPAQAPTTYYSPGSIDCPNTVTLTGDGTHKWWVSSLDVYGNTEKPHGYQDSIDDVGPTTTAIQPDGSWSAGPVTAKLQATDNLAGVAVTYYSIGANPPDPRLSGALYDPSAPPVVPNGQKIRFWSRDLAGNPEGAPTTSPAVRVDSTPPTALAYTLGGYIKNSWSHTPLTISIFSDDALQSGVAGVHCWVNPPVQPTSYSSPGTVPCPSVLDQDGTYTIWTAAIDAVGNQGVPQSAFFKVDLHPPTVTMDPLPNAWQRDPMTVTFHADDGKNGSGVESIQYTIGVNPSKPNAGSPKYDPAHRPVLYDNQRIRYIVSDNSGFQTSDATSAPAMVDTIAPVTHMTAVPAWSAGPLTVALTADDGAGSGNAVIRYTLGTAPAAPTSSSPRYDAAHPPVLHDGELIRFFATDLVGNAETVQTSATLHVDSTAPVTTLGGLSAEVTRAPQAITLTATDTQSGVAAIHYTAGANPAVPTAASPAYDPAAKPVLHDGERISYFAVDAVGNAEAVHTSAAAKVDDVAPAAPAITAHPDATTPAHSATFAFTGEDGATFACSLDDAPAAACTSPVTYDDLTLGTHRFVVTAADAVGNVSEAASASFEVVAPPAATPTPTPSPVPQPAQPQPAPVPPVVPAAEPLTAKAITVAKPALDTRGLSVRIGCDELACKVTVTAEVLVPHHAALKLRAVTTSLAAGAAQKSLRLAATAKLRKLLRHGTKARVRFTIKATGADGRTVTTTRTVSVGAG